MASSSSQSPPNQQQVQPRGPAFAKWPTVKIFMPPKGRFSPKRDEWCLTYCTQSITGRIHAAQPSCTTLCIRKVFEHEVRNVAGFKRHDMSVMRNDDTAIEVIEGKGKDKGLHEASKVVRKTAVYPLPAEGQPENVPRVLGGAESSKSHSLSSTTSSSSTTLIPTTTTSTPTVTTRSWSPGYYLFTSTTIYGTFEHLASMSRDLPRQVARQKMMESMKREWVEYQEWAERIQRGEIQGVEGSFRTQREENAVTASETETQPEEASEIMSTGRKRPPQPLPDYLSSTLLVPVPPASISQLSSHILTPISKFLKPSGRALELLGNDLQGGIFQQFASRVYTKAQTDEPAKLARRSWERLLEAWKGDGGDGKDGGIKG
ncbi:uncharacterized protein C8R40DRAFT_1072094 [Lentinula edodes]|uniref:uncharacterized protein n=1 Tax=Lentinula edodes TaxID=5353 RepID=UPI001E8E3677|nr:uncharacterized protein C8R40DRAFT_1072094 [Lentinula edodes]KAH7872017.1 hypothetical protein C8R40DRAFT_1072094 [Lentinula edodes]